MDLELLLVDADDRSPTLGEGLALDALGGAPKPRTKDTFLRRKPGADSNDLPAQRWGLVVPEGDAGQRLLTAVAPLIRLREAEQGGPAQVFQVPAGMDAQASLRFRQDVYLEAAEAERPYYLAILGDLHEVSAELQQSLANSALVGRIAFADAAGSADLGAYTAYAEKVVGYAERAAPDDEPDAYFYAARDGTAATVTGQARLVRPCLAEAERQRGRGKFPAARVAEIAGNAPDELLRAAAGSRPSVLLSVSHGLGAPRGGWASPDRQRAQQGALSLGGDDVLDAAYLRRKSFLPGGMWFCLACFSAGTPAAGSSAYYAWLKLLAADGAYGARVDAVLKSLPGPDARPFVAALPQAALANPDGPLAVIGHLDLAWTYGFTGGKDGSESRGSRFLSSFKALVNGSRAGVALDALMTSYRETTDALRSSYQLESDARVAGRANPTDPIERAQLMMVSNDLRGYVLLGDPAARLPLRATGGGTAKAAPAGAVAVPEIRAVVEAKGAVGETSATMKEAAVLALLHGDDAPRALAARSGVTVTELWDWFDAYRAGGRARLGG